MSKNIKVVEDKLNKFFADSDKWEAEHPFQMFFINILDFFRYSIPNQCSNWKYSVKYAWQRAFRGYDDVMLFSTYSEVTELMLKVLSWHRNSRHGSPAVSADVIAHEHSKKCGDDGKGTAACEKDIHRAWDVALEKMIAGFQALKESDDIHLLDKNGRYDHKRSETERKRLLKVWETGAALFVKHFRGLWD